MEPNNRSKAMTRELKHLLANAQQQHEAIRIGAVKLRVPTNPATLFVMGNLAIFAEGSRA